MDAPHSVIISGTASNLRFTLQGHLEGVWELCVKSVSVESVAPHRTEPQIWSIASDICQQKQFDRAGTLTICPAILETFPLFNEPLSYFSCGANVWHEITAKQNRTQLIIRDHVSGLKIERPDKVIVFMLYKRKA